MTTPNDTPEVIQCKSCKQWLPATTDYFYAEKLKKSGLSGKCRECIKAQTRQYHHDNAKCLIPKMRVRYQNNKQSHREREKIWRQNNKAKSDVIVSEWVKNNPERRRQIANRYAKSDKGAIARLRRRARVLNYPDTFTDDQWEVCLSWWGNHCAYCGRHESELPSSMNADHVIPLANPNCVGTIASNILPACRACNVSKKDRELTTWLNRRFPDTAAEILARIQVYFRWIIDNP